MTWIMMVLILMLTMMIDNDNSGDSGDIGDSGDSGDDDDRCMFDNKDWSITTIQISGIISSHPNRWTDLSIYGM